MGLAIDTIDVIATAMEISNIDLEISLIDNRRQRLSFTIQDLSTEFSTKLSQKNIDLSDDLATDEEKDDLELDWEQFKIEYDVAMAKLNSQDKVLEEERTKLEVILYDERLTTLEVQKVMISADVSRNKRKKVVDTLAATLILQSYLDSIR